MGEQKAFLIYKRYWKQIQRMSKEQAGELLQAIFAYACDGVVIDFEDFAVEMLFGVIRDDIDMYEDKYDDIRAKRSEAGKKSAEKRQREKEEAAEQNPTKATSVEFVEQTPTNANKSNNTNTNTNTNTLKEKEYTTYIPKRKVENFIPPTVEEVSNYAKQMNYTGFSAESFVNFYQSKGWMVGKNKMKDWKAAVVGWYSRDKNKPPASNLAKTPMRNAQNNEKRNLDFLAR